MINLLFLIPSLVYTSSGIGSSIPVSSGQISTKDSQALRSTSAWNWLKMISYTKSEDTSRTYDFVAYDIIVCSGDHFES